MDISDAVRNIRYGYVRAFDSGWSSNDFTIVYRDTSKVVFWACSYPSEFFGSLISSDESGPIHLFVQMDASQLSTEVAEVTAYIFPDAPPAMTEMPEIGAFAAEKFGPSITL